jgi:hypothetical protein
MIKHLPRAAGELLERYIGPMHASLAVKKARLLIATLADRPAAVSPYPTRYTLETPPIELLNHANVFCREGLSSRGMAGEALGNRWVFGRGREARWSNRLSELRGGALAAASTLRVGRKCYLFFARITCSVSGAVKTARLLMPSVQRQSCY